jgi:hypothetical protein
MGFDVYSHSHFLLVMSHFQLLKLYLRNQLFLFFTSGKASPIHLRFKNFFGFDLFLKSTAKCRLFDEQLLTKEHFILKAY